MHSIQVPTLVLPTSYSLGTGTLASTETIADALEHTSSELYIGDIHEKNAQIMATEVVAAGIPGPLNCWVELSPWPSANNTLWPAPLPTSTLFWAALGGGGGALAPTAPYVEVGTGVNLTPHGLMIPFNEYSYWMRVVVQTPVVVATAYWVVQVIISGNSD
jgi:hypothetical protein